MKSSRSLLTVLGIVLAIAVLVGLPVYLYRMVSRPIHDSGLANKAMGVINKAKQEAALDSQLQASGKTADAVILQVSDAGFATKRFTQLVLDLKVMPKGKKPFTVKTKKMISLSHAFLFQAGAKLKVKYDPSHPGEVSLLTSPQPAATGQKDASQRMEKLEQLRKKGLITNKEYQKKREEILKEL